MKNNIIKKAFSKDMLTIYFVIALYAIVSVMLYGGFAKRQLINMLIPMSRDIVLAISLNLVVGLLGELSLGHAGFLSVGLFTGCLFSMWSVSFLPMYIRLPLAMIVGGIFAAAVGFIVGLPTLRLKGDYLAIVTLAFCQIIMAIITNLEIFGGPRGLYTNKPDKYIMSNVKELFPYAIVLVLITVIVMINIKKSKIGRAIMAIRDNRIAAESTGINVTYYKLIVFVLAAFFAGAIGVLYGHSSSNFQASTFDYNMSIEILVIVVLGGMGSIPGSIIAAIALRVLPEMLREFSDYRMLAYSVLLIGIMLLNSNQRFVELKKSLSFKKLVSVFKSKSNNKGGEAI
ncbi:MAG: branched-chain amino acid ABC transporter permease [Clostridia bacterium]|nr:branched-chain amino acid ABC transporter permease [Clostridia bacterium]